MTPQNEDENQREEQYDRAFKREDFKMYTLIMITFSVIVTFIWLTYDEFEIYISNRDFDGTMNIIKSYVIGFYLGLYPIIITEVMISTAEVMTQYKTAMLNNNVDTDLCLRYIQAFNLRLIVFCSGISMMFFTATKILNPLFENIKDQTYINQNECR